MSEYRTGAVGGAPGGYDTTQSLAFTERSAQPAHQYSSSRSSSGLQRAAGIKLQRSRASQGGVEEEEEGGNERRR